MKFNFMSVQSFMAEDRNAWIGVVGSLLVGTFAAFCTVTTNSDYTDIKVIYGLIFLCCVAWLALSGRRAINLVRRPRRSKRWVEDGDTLVFEQSKANVVMQAMVNDLLPVLLCVAVIDSCARSVIDRASLGNLPGWNNILLIVVAASLFAFSSIVLSVSAHYMFPLVSRASIDQNGVTFGTDGHRNTQSIGWNVPVDVSRALNNQLILIDGGKDRFIAYFPLHRMGLLYRDDLVGVIRQYVEDHGIEPKTTYAMTPGD